MSNASMLAAVHSAIGNETSSADNSPATRQPEPKEDDMAAAKKGDSGASAKPEPAAEPAASTVDSLRADHPDLVAQIEADAATKERDRILGIEANAMPGHEKLVSDCKADPNVTPDQAATKIVQAEKALRESQAAGIQAVEDHTSGVAVAPANPAAESASQAVGTEESWSAAYNAQDEKGAKIRAEFPTEGSYVGYMRSIQPGADNVVNFGPVNRKSG